VLTSVTKVSDEIAGAEAGDAPSQPCSGGRTWNFIDGKSKVSAGGKRLGAGRPKGSRDRATAAQGAALSELARQHTATALKTLVTIATTGQSEAARISAATAILDRGYGRPPQALQHSGLEKPIIIHFDAIDAAL
jgi:hypothetical protein